MSVIDYDTEPTFAQRYLGTVTDDSTLQAKDAKIERLLTHNGKLADELEETLIMLGRTLHRVEQLEQAGWDVLPTLELYWKGERPIPEWHATGALRRVLEEGQE